jgi:hypothetical protein
MENLDKDERILLILQTICEMRNKEQENTRLKEEIKKTALHIKSYLFGRWFEEYKDQQRYINVDSHLDRIIDYSNK